MLRGVLIHKAFRFRIYPTEEQVARIGAWEHALRFLWNLAHEQRLMGLNRCKGEKVYPTAFDQINDLTALRAELPWLADVPRDVCAQALSNLDAAWQRCFRGLGRTPRWKRKGRDAISISEPHPKAWRLVGNTLTFPKIGEIKAVVHRPLEGKPKTCTIVQDVDQWFTIVTCEVEMADPIPAEGMVAIDRGVVNLLADSDGGIVENPRFVEAVQKRIAKAQRMLAKKKKGSANAKKAGTKVARLHRKIRRQRDHVLHSLSSKYAKSHGVIVLEKLDIGNMTTSAHGTVQEPGRNVRQKAGLNRRILGAGWGKLGEMLKYKAARHGGRVVEMFPAYSSQTCAKCTHINASNRQSQSVFVCVKCGHRDHADVNAAKVLKAWAVESAVQVCGGDAEVRRPAKQKLRVARRGTVKKDEATLSPVLQGGDDLPRSAHRTQ